MEQKDHHFQSRQLMLPILRETKFVVPLLLIFLLFMIVPEAITWLTEPDGLIFNGAFINITDFNVYLSAIRQGAEGSWLFNPQFTPETFPPYLSFLPYILAGKMQSLLGGGPILWYQVLKYTAWTITAASLIVLVDTVFPKDLRLQKSALLLIFFSSGIGWLMLLFTRELTLLTPDLFVPEWNLMTASYAAPHFLLGIALQAAFYSSLIKLLERWSARQAVNQLFIGIGLSLVYPYQIVVNGLTLAAYFLYQSVASRRIPWNQLIRIGALSIPMLAALAYYGFYLPQNPIYREVIVTNNDINPPPLVGMLVGFGLLLPLAAAGLREWWRRSYPKVILFWFAINFAAIYLPLSFSGRFTTGLIVPLCLMAAFGFEGNLLPAWLDRFKNNGGQPANRLRTALIGLTVPSTFFFVLYFFSVVNTYPIFPYYNRVEDDAAAQWIGENTIDEDLVLAAFPFNNLLPRYGKGRVFFGHFDLTIDMEGRFGIMDTFWDPATSDSWRHAFIDEWGFTYLYQGHYENALSGEQHLIFPYEVIYATDEVTIYRLP